MGEGYSVMLDFLASRFIESGGDWGATHKRSRDPDAFSDLVPEA